MTITVTSTAPTSTAPRRLPEPALTRWQPLRAGLVDLFYYDQEEFWFRDGRLLLRGNNGTGKSKVLALTLPFLLDGELSPHRVEPDADPKKKMEWNLLLGGAHPYPERLGYTWVEFGRLDERGEAHFCTLGCGLKAVSGRGIARHWFFVSSSRVGPELALVDATGTALTRDRLIDALSGPVGSVTHGATHGTVYDRAKDYRRAVDERLFGFGEQRYGALVDMLVQLRQPQLSKRPSEKALSAALTEALPPLDQAVIADVAEAFRSLEHDRNELTTMTEARDAATSFLVQYRRYARIAARRRAAAPRKAQSGYAKVQEDLATAEAALAKAEQDLRAAKDRLIELETERTRLRATDEALRASPEARSQRELERTGEDARALAKRADTAVQDREAAARRLATQRGRHAAATERLAEATSALSTARASTASAAAPARITAEHLGRVDEPINQHDQQPEPAELRRIAGELADRQQRAIEHVQRLLAQAATAAGALTQSRRALGVLDTEADDLAQRRAQAKDDLDLRGGELVSAMRRHLDDATELRLADPAATLAELELWVETLDGPNPATAQAQAAGHIAGQSLARADAALERELHAATARADELTSEIDSLERGEHTAPPAPHTRDAHARTGRPGAPLWQLIDFTDQVSEPDRAGIEAALEASGLLDAWVTPDGELLGPDVADVLLRPGVPARRNVTEVLAASVDRADPNAAAVSDQTVRALLATIGLAEAGSSQNGSSQNRSSQNRSSQNRSTQNRSTQNGSTQNGSTWVAPDGRFRIGPLDGAWHKPLAGYIGRGAREAARRARLVVLRAELAEVRDETQLLAELRSELAERVSTLRGELAALPDDAALRQAHAHIGTLLAEAERLARRRERAEQAVSAALAADEGARAELTEGASDADLPAEAGALVEVQTALNNYRVALAGLWPAMTRLREAADQARDVAEDLAQAQLELDERAERAATSADAATGAEQRYQTLLSTVGAAVAELAARLAEITQRLETNQSGHRDAQRESDRALGAQGKAQGHREQLTAQLSIATEQRAEAAESFRRFTATGLLAVALPELETPDPSRSWAPDPTVRLARRVNDELSGVADDDATWDRTQRQLTIELKTLQDTLARHGNRAEAQMREDGVVIEVDFQNRRASVPQLTEALTTEVTDRERLLSEREREILENHLVNEVASTLQELISAADAQVLLMNNELAHRPTSTGMKLRLLWQARPDGSAGLEAARERLLRQDSDAWAGEDRAAVGAFLQSEISRVRAKNAQGTWLEHLTEALDYRSWNHFVIQRHQNGQWRPAAGPASGGERVLAASVPLFAAASAHYASAGNPHAPRLVTLDEAFAGVDDNARAKYLGLLAAFELDVVMTSEREWGCYPEVPGLAIAQLSRTDDVAAVLVTNWEWDGNSRRRVDRPVHPVHPVAAPAPASAPAAELDGLWG